MRIYTIPVHIQLPAESEEDAAEKLDAMLEELRDHYELDYTLYEATED